MRSSGCPCPQCVLCGLGYRSRRGLTMTAGDWPPRSGASVGDSLAYRGDIGGGVVILYESLCKKTIFRFYFHEFRVIFAFWFSFWKECRFEDSESTA